MTTPRAGLLAIALTVGCTSSAPATNAKPARDRVYGGSMTLPQPEPAPEDDTPEEPADPAPDPALAPADDPRFRCTKDDECTQTCALGAVNTAWLREHPNADTCDDGCYWKNDSVRCNAGSCATMTMEGEVDPGCTHVTTPRG